MRPYSRSQRGQAMTEFVAAMAVFVPIIIGGIYIFKYNDIKHQAIQASRYAAMQNALDSRQENDTVVGQETVARFFRDDATHSIGLNDKPGASTDGDANLNWSELDGSPLLGNDYSGITVTLSNTSANSALLTPVNLVADAAFSDLTTGYGNRAAVAVPLATIVGYAPLSALNITIGATTVMAGDSWSGGGATAIAGQYNVLSVPGKAFAWLHNVALDPLFEVFAGTTGPDLGAVKPDIVPADDLK